MLVHVVDIHAVGCCIHLGCVLTCDFLVNVGQGGRAIFQPKGAGKESEKPTINPFSKGPTLHFLTGTSAHAPNTNGGSNERRQPGGILAAMATPDFQLKVSCSIDHSTRARALIVWHDIY